MLALAFRNLLRNPKRSAITLAAIVVGVWGLIFAWAFIDGVNEQMIANSIRYLAGHIKIHHRGYHEAKVIAKSMAAAVPRALRTDPRIAAIAPRVEGGALVGTKQAAETVQVYGVDPAREIRVTSLDRTIVKGRYLSGRPREIVLGDDLARELAVTVGRRVDVVVQGADGSIGADRFNVVGLYNSGIDVLDQSLVLMPIASAQDIYSLPGRLTAWVVRLENRGNAASLAQHLKRSLGDSYEVYSWERLLPSVIQAAAFHRALGYVVLLVIFVVVAAGIANTMLMSVTERLHEFGVLQAIGTGANQILALVLWEALLLGLAGIVIGNAVGTAFTHYWSIHGIDLSAYTEAMETMPGLSGMVQPLLRPDHLLMISALVLAVSVTPALLPAWRASRMQPVDAIRGLEPRAGLASRLERLFTIPARWLWCSLAWRNLHRNPRRALLTAGAMAFGMAAFVFLYAFVDGFLEQMVVNSTSLLSAHIQISAGKSGKDDKIFDASTISARLLDDARFRAVSPRLERSGVVARARTSTPVQWIGVAAAQETHVTRLDTLIDAGSYLARRDGIVMGESLAEKLGVTVGQKVILTAQDTSGQLVSVAAPIAGVFRTGSEVFDKGYVFMDIGQMRRLFALGDHDVTALAIRLNDRHRSRQMAAELSGELAPLGLRARPWQAVSPIVVQMIAMSRVDFYLILAVIFVVVGFGVMNTMLMSVMERVREVGVLLAIGTAPRQILTVIVYEAMMLGAGGIMAGGLAGGILAGYFHTHGIDLTAFAKSLVAIPGMTDKVAPIIIVDHLVLPSAALYALGVLVSLYPAWKAANLDPVRALRSA